MARVKAKDHENLTEANIKKVIELLEGDTPITKKAACEVLNISYNTTRLNKIIEQYKEEVQEAARRRAANRGKPATDFEIQHIIESFMDGESITDIAKQLYRSPGLVKEVIEKVGVPQKPTGASYTSFGLIPDQCVSDEFKIGQIVWSAKRHCLAIVRREETNVKDKSSRYYQIYVIEPIEERSPYFPYENYGGYYDGARAYDLGSLEHLKRYGIDIYRPYRQTFGNWLC